jgi:LysR family transcriptional regulator for bpeEF and oprC
MDRFDAMRAYVQVVDTGSFTRAARALGLHKSTVSDQVGRLEERLGARLLARTTRSVVPTAEGLAFHRRAGAILQQVDEAEALLRTGRHAPSGRLRVDVPVAIGRLVLVPEIRGFLERYPRISLELGCTDRVVDLVREGVDCAIRGGDLPDSTLVARRVGDVAFVLCAAPRYVDEHGLPAEPEALARHVGVGYLPPGASAVRDIRLTRGERTVDVAMPSRFVTTDSAAVLNAGLDGLGIIQIAEHVAAHPLASGALLRVLPAWRSPSLPLHLVVPSARQRTARVLAFMDWAQQVLTRRLGLDGRSRGVG